MPSVIFRISPLMSHFIAPNPVLLLHGIGDTHTIFQKMTAYLEKLGRVVHGLDFVPNNGDAGIDELAAQVAAYVEQTFPDSQPIDVVGFSMGGLVGRYYVQRLAAPNQVHRLVTLASPHQGTWVGWFRNNLGARQMRRNSTFIKDLNQDLTRLEQINYTSIWTPYDLMIVPAESSRLPVGQEEIIWVLAHPLMVIDARCLKSVAAALAEPLKSPSSAGNAEENT